MAEDGGLIEGVLGAGEAEGPDGDAPSGLDPIAAALATGLTRTDAAVAPDLTAYLKKQAKLVEIQTEHLHEQRAVVLTNLKLKRASERLKVGLQLFFVGVASAMALVVGLWVWDAAHDQSLVVEPFQVPPDLAARGVTGRVLATHLLDKLGEINAKADSTRLPTSYAGNWGEEVKVEIPETGVSVGELRGFLKGWLGHETHVTGELERTPSGLALTVRSGEDGARTVVGSETDLDALLQKGAEAAFRQTQPYRYAKYLENTGQIDAALAASRDLASSRATVRERAWAYSNIGGLLEARGQPEESIGVARVSERLDPTIATTAFNEVLAWYVLGRDEQVLAKVRSGLKLLVHPSADFDPNAAAYIATSNASLEDDLLGDYRSAVEKLREVAALPDWEDNARWVPADLAVELARGHDVAGSLREAGDAAGLDEAGAAQLFGAWGDALTPHFERAVALDRWDVAAEDMRRTIAAAPQDRGGQLYLVPRFLQPRLAYALARGGRQAEAEAAASALPDDCYRCLRARGWVATTARDWLRADAAFAAAARLAPSLPLAYADWAQSRLARGDVDGAIAELALAAEKGPHFADAKELWGEALIRRGDFAGAVEKFAAAEPDAPRWGRLHLKWSEALAKLGKADEARAQRRAAAAQDLSAADREALRELK